MKKKISYSKYAEIMRFKKKHLRMRLFCSFYLEKNGNNYAAIDEVTWPAYILLFIPAHLWQLVAILWDGGLREFSIESRPINKSWIYPKTASYPLCEEIWNEKETN